MPLVIFPQRIFRLLENFPVYGFPFFLQKELTHGLVCGYARELRRLILADLSDFTHLHSKRIGFLCLSLRRQYCNERGAKADVRNRIPIVKRQLTRARKKLMYTFFYTQKGAPFSLEEKCKLLFVDFCYVISLFHTLKIFQKF